MEEGNEKRKDAPKDRRRVFEEDPELLPEHLHRALVVGKGVAVDGLLNARDGGIGAEEKRGGFVWRGRRGRGRGGLVAGVCAHG